MYLALQVAIVAYVYSELLISEGHIMHPFHQWLTKLLTKTSVVDIPDNTPYEVQQMQGYEPKKLQKIEIKKSPLLKPLGDCPLCLSGQLMLWTFLFHYLILPRSNQVVNTVFHFVTSLTFTICFAILLTLALKKLLEKWGR